MYSIIIIIYKCWQFKLWQNPSYNAFLSKNSSELSVFKKAMNTIIEC